MLLEEFVELHEGKGHLVVPSDSPAEKLYGYVCFECGELSEMYVELPVQLRDKRECMRRKCNCKCTPLVTFDEDFSITAHWFGE